jgi:hypothetical protein
MNATINEATTCTLAELADALSESTERLRPFVEAGVIRANERGAFPLMESISGYVSFWRSIVEAAEARKLSRRASRGVLYFAAGKVCCKRSWCVVARRGVEWHVPARSGRRGSVWSATA